MIKLFILFTILSAINGAKILAFFNMPSVSHQNSFRPIWENLAARGHEVTVITPNPTGNSSLKNVREIDVSVGYDVFKQIDVSNVRRSEMSPYSIFSTFSKLGDTSLKLEMESEGFQEILKLSEDYFDLMILEAHCYPIYGLLHKFKAPAVSISSLGCWSHMHLIFGNTIHPILYPEHDSAHFNRKHFTIWEKLDSIYVSMSQMLQYRFYLPEADKLARKIFGDDIPYIEELARRSSLLFLNKNPIFSERRPNVPNVIEYYHTERKSIPLPKDLQTILDNAQNGAVFFSLGTNVRFNNVRNDIKTQILEALGQLPYTVLCKWDTEDIPNKPQNVVLRKWFPQTSILAHPRIKMFVTQGGLQSSEEALLEAVPVVVIPFLGDQILNAEILASYGVAEKISPDELTGQLLKQKILKVAESISHHERAKELQTILLDQPQSGIEKVVWWCEYVIRHKGAVHLRSPGADIKLYEYLMLDIFAVLLVALFLFYRTIKLMFQFCISLKNRIKKSKSE